MRVLVCGGRAYQDWQRVYSVLDRIQARRRITLVIEGGAQGADRFGYLWALSRGIPTQRYPAAWHRYGKRAGSVRNAVMLREGQPDLVVAFSGGVGTRDMIARAVDAGVRVCQIKELQCP